MELAIIWASGQNRQALQRRWIISENKINLVQFHTWMYKDEVGFRYSRYSDIKFQLKDKVWNLKQRENK